MKKLRWQLIIIFLTGLVVGALLLSEQPAVQTALSTPMPETGGVYTEALIGSMERLNPVLDFFNPSDREINRVLYSSLLRFDSRGLPVVDVAESWGISKDGTIYNFTLNSKARWHDGKPLTAEDVVFTVELLKNGGRYVPSDLQALWKDVEVQAYSDTMLQFRLPEAFAPFQDYLTFGILPKHIYNGKNLDQIADSDANLQPVGSGPYKVDRILTEGSKISGVALSIFDGYFKKKPFLQQVIFQYYPDSASAFKAYQDGKVQGIGKVSADILPQVLATPNLAVYSSRKPEMYLVLFNHKDPQATFLKEPAVRKALMVGLNRQYLINRIFKGQAILANGPILPDNWAYYGDTDPLTYSPDTAKNMLRDAGYLPASDKGGIRKKGDVSLSLELLYPEGSTYQAMAEQIAKDWTALGVQVTTSGVPYNELIGGRLDSRSYQAALVSLNLSKSYDPDPYPFWDQAQMTGGQNYTQWDNRMASEYLEQARMSTDYGERVRLYRNFQVIFNQELPALPLFYPVESYAVDRQVQGISVGPLYESSDRFATISNWFLAAKKASAPTRATTPTPAK